jgi:hypothetical protein
MNKLNLMKISILFAAILSSCTAHEKHYVVGNSITQSMELREFINLYLKAKCDGNAETILLMLDPSSLRVMAREELCTMLSWLQKLPEACELKVSKIIDASEGYGIPYYFVILEQKSSPGKEYRFDIEIKNGCFFIEGTLKKREDFGID